MNPLPSRPPRRPRWKPPEPPHLRPRRDQEALLLAAALLTLVAGLVLVYLAVAAPFSEVEAGLERGEILDLNALSQPERLAPHLTFSSDRGERAFLAGRIFQHLTRPGAEPAANVGELGKLRVGAADLAKAGAPRLAQRLAARQAALPGPERAAATVRLLTDEELQEVKPRLIVRRPAQFRGAFWRWSALQLVAFAAVHLAWRRLRFRGDQVLLPLVALLTGLGLLVMLAVRDPLRDLLLFRSFSGGVALGCLALAAASFLRVEGSRLRKASFLALVAALLLSALLIAFGSGPGASDAKVNLLGFQPVEAIKLLLVLFFAGYFAERWEFLREIKERRRVFARLPRWLRPPKLEYALPPLLAIAAVLVFFFLQRDLGPALVFAFLFLLLYAVARGRALLALVGTALVIGGFFAGYALRFPRTVAGRIEMWLSPWDNLWKGGDHLAHSLWAFASGGLAGTGLGLGAPGSVPEAHTDLVLAVVGEELGFAGLVLVLGLYAILIWRGFKISLEASGLYSFFLGLGLTLLTALQLVLIAGGVLGVIPLSGVVTPFLSYGRSSMLANLLLVGLLLAISNQRSPGSAGERFRPALRWAWLPLGLLLAAIVGKAGYVQALRADQVLTTGVLSVQGDDVRRFRYNPRLVEIARLIPRGSILDRNAVPLATGDPALLAPHRETYEALRVPVAELEGGAGSRFYPLAGRAFHLLGDVRNQLNWPAGNSSYIERDLRVRLQGYDDHARVVQVRQKDGSVQGVFERDYRELVPLLRYRALPQHPAVRRLLERERDVKLTVDARLQAGVADALVEVVHEAGSRHGAAVVLDALSGEVLASVSYPWPEALPLFDRQREEESLLDRARYGAYPPGSTFKIVTAMAALRHDPAAGQQTFQCVALEDGRAGHSVRGWGRPIRDDRTVHQPHGTVDLARGIAFSCNAYFAQLAVYEVGGAALLDTASLLDIEVARPNNVQALRDALPQASYGQGQVLASPFQMARVAATVASGGSMPQGRWVADESNTRGEPPRLILGRAHAAELGAAMRQVVTVGSAAATLGDVQPPIAGKTGTAEVPRGASHSWFIGYAPYDEAGAGRTIAWSVLVENGGYGSRVAAKVAAAIVRQLDELGYFGER